MPAVKRPNVVRAVHVDNYVKVQNETIRDKCISFRAKGILAYCLSRPPDWNIRISDIVNHSPKEKEEAIRSAIKELASNGYARLIKGGQDGGGCWQVFETKELLEERLKEEGHDKNGDMAVIATSGLERHGGNPDVGENPLPGNRYPTKYRVVLKTEKKNKEEIPL